MNIAINIFELLMTFVPGVFLYYVTHKEDNYNEAMD
jgi:hypothetical protein